MPKTRQDLTEILQTRVTTEDKKMIEEAADADQTSVAEFSRRALRDAARRKLGKRTLPRTAPR